MQINTQFEPGAVVTHIVERARIGVIVGFMVRGQNHSYQVQWGVEKSEWHLDFELLAQEEKEEIGLWRSE